MVASAGKFPGGYYQNAFETAGELEESGSSGRIDTDIAASEHSSAPMRKCISLNSRRQNRFGVPTHVLPLVSLSRSERKELIRRLRLELEQTRIMLKKLELQWTNGISVASSSDILSCSNAANGPHAASFGRSVVTKSATGKKSIPTNKGHGLSKRIGSQKTQSAKEVSASSTTNIVLMKQCGTLLKRMMSHQYGWVFNEPVDVVKLNIPDYLTIIKHPMDLGTVKKKISSGLYSNPLEFLADVRLTFKNALEYNPPGHDVYAMADTLSKFFEVRWKTIEKKLPRTESLLEKSEPSEDLEIIETSPAKKIKLTSFQDEFPGPVKRVMTDEEKHNLGRELESLLGEMPANIIDFLRKQSSSGTDGGEDEIEIDIDELSDDTLFTLRKLLDEYLEEKQKNLARGEPCEIELLNESGPSNSAIHHHRGCPLFLSCLHRIWLSGLYARSFCPLDASQMMCF
uniref:Transcription factor GTE8-like n=1 Tax=Rhizophora mucronata TaxID=61149 RepID=A0A2P2M5I2_RHIMU